MFNFNLQKRAFDELNAEQFRLVYLLNNTLSMVNETTQNYHNNKIEMYNGYMMDKLGLSERQVQRLIKGLEQLGYITVKRATAKKSPNIITINCDKDCDKNGDKNVTLNKNTFNKTKEIYKDFSTCSKSTCNEENNIKEKNIKKEMKDKNLFKNSQNTMQTNTNAQAINSPSKEEIISKAINNINLDKSSMFRAKTQAEYNAALKDLKHQLKKIQDNTSIEAYKNYRAGLAKWYRASVQHMKFAKNKAQKTDEDVCLQQPKVYLEKNIKPIDVRILQYWVDERNKANAQEQKDKAQNMIDALLLKWQETYEAKTILKVCQEYNLFAAGEPQTTMMEQQPTKQKTTQYKPLEEECGDFVTDNHQVYYIKPQSMQMAN